MATFKGFIFIEETFGKILNGDPIIDAMIIWVSWNKMIEKLNPIHRYKVEDIKSDVSVRFHSKVHREGYRLLTYDELKIKSPKWYDQVIKMVKEYNYL